jgi:glycosyltransferase involved in cell wall biosynthesis
MLRTLSFSKYLSDYGWKPIVLTINPRAYPSVRSDQMSEVPADVPVLRAQGWDAGRHLSVKGRYPRWVALPDRWASWCIHGVIRGLRAIRNYSPSVLWSTYPIGTAHLTALWLARLTRLPWVADFRDPMCQDGYPPDPRQWKALHYVERHTVQLSARSVFTAPGAVRIYRERYPGVAESRWTILENGFDEASFADVDRVTPAADDEVFTLVHSGTVYPAERDPRPLFEAIARLKRRVPGGRLRLRVLLRATGHDDLYRPVLCRNEIEDVVSLEPPLPYGEALKEMCAADGLLLLQGADCHFQIPAKLYEYLRCGRPILALTDPDGDTATVLKTNGVTTITPWSDPLKIERELERFMVAVQEHRAPVPDGRSVQRYSRQAQTRKLAEIFEEITGEVWRDS